MRRTSSLERLADAIAIAHGGKLVPSLEALTEWHALARQCLAEARDEWLTEPAFRLRTRASTRWCRQNFDRCKSAGLARRTPKGRREWHVSARPPRAQPGDRAAVIDHIVDTYKAAS